MAAACWQWQPDDSGRGARSHGLYWTNSLSPEIAVYWSAMTKLYEALAEILEVDEVHPGEELQGFEGWDSLAALPLAVSVRDSFGVVIPTGDLRRATMVADLEQLVRSKHRSGRAS